jgi:hypothetical protein
MLKPFVLMAALMAQPLLAQEAEPPMSLGRMVEIVTALDPDAGPEGGGISFTIQDVPVIIFADPAMNRMRAMVPIRRVEGMTEDELSRVMQANFDTALDARYAIARGQLWAVFIHPLKELERDQLISGIGQTVNIALTYGTLYHGGAVQFGGGDSTALQEKLLEDLLKKGQDI